MVEFSRSNSSVKVALRVRPLISKEMFVGENLVNYPFENQISLKDKFFTFDHLFKESDGTSVLYKSAILPLKNSFLEGYNCTVFAYGQTGSGKTYTVGTDNMILKEIAADKTKSPIIPLFVEDLFSDVEKLKSANESEISIFVSFYEIHNNTIKDLLNTNNSNLQIREIGAEYNENNRREIKILGLTETQIFSPEEALEQLKDGSFNRTTGSTNMNAHSSRSHAIFTFSMKRESESEIVFSKFHFVDLAGSERLKKTQSEGDRLKESIEINTGLLALGNVISALGDPQNSKTFVPFRDSKITRILEDSLGGNSKTLMIACVSPHSDNFNESLNTLKYANRAKNIKNKPIINKDKNAIKLEKMKQRIIELETFISNSQFSKDTGADFLELTREKKELIRSKKKAEAEALEYKALLEEITKRLITVEKERDVAILKCNRLYRKFGEVDTNSDFKSGCCELTESYLNKITQLEIENERLKCLINKGLGNDKPNNAPEKTVAITLNKTYLLGKNSSELEEEHSRLSLLTKKIEEIIEANNHEEISWLLEQVEESVDENKIGENLSEAFSNLSISEKNGPIVNCENKNELVERDEESKSKSSTSEAIDGYYLKKESQKNILFNICFEMQRKKILIEELLKTRRESKKMKQIFEKRIEEMKFEVSQVQRERDRVLEKIKSNKQEEINEQLQQAMSKVKTLEIDLKDTKKKLENKTNMFLVTQKDNRIRKLKIEINEFKNSKIALQKKIREESIKFQHKINDINLELKTEIKNKRKLDFKYQKLQTLYENQTRTIEIRSRELKQLRSKTMPSNKFSRRKNLSLVCEKIDHEMNGVLENRISKEEFISEISKNYHMSEEQGKEIFLFYLSRYLQVLEERKNK